MAHFIMIHKAIDTSTDIYLNIIYCRSNHTIHCLYIYICERISHKFSRRSRSIPTSNNDQLSWAMTSSLWQRRGSGKLKPNPICTTATGLSDKQKKHAGKFCLKSRRLTIYKVLNFMSFLECFFLLFFRMRRLKCPIKYLKMFWFK